MVVSPYARRDYVSSVVHDHTSILALLEHTFNLPALTARDGAADDLLDCLDLTAPPAFLTPPTLAAPLNPSVDTPLCTAPGPRSPTPTAEGRVLRRFSIASGVVRTLSEASVEVGAHGARWFLGVGASC